MRLKAIVFISYFTVCFFLANSVLADKNQLAEKLASIFTEEIFTPAHSGLMVSNVETGAVVYNHNADKCFIPASNVKLITTAAALYYLGKDYRYHTGIYINGKIIDGVVDGDLIIKGSGDPTWDEHYYEDIYTVYNQWAKKLQQLGIKAIKGNLIGDTSCFDECGWANGWAWNDLKEWYAAQASGLCFNDNCVDLLMAPGDKVGTPLKILSIKPELPYLEIINQSITLKEAEKNTVYFRKAPKPGEKVIITGDKTIKAKPFKQWIAVDEPAKMAMLALANTLNDNSIQLGGTVKIVNNFPSGLDISSATLLFQHLSPPLTEIIKTTNKRSQNLYAEQLLKTLGKEIEGDGTFTSGLKVVERFLNQIGVKPETYRLHDGSGLSRHNVLTPEQLVKVLNFMYKSEVKEPLWNSLPIAGVDGSLSSRMQTLKGKVYAKSGYMDMVSALSGYIKCENGKIVSFSMITNGFMSTKWHLRRWEREVCENIYKYFNASDY